MRCLAFVHSLAMIALGKVCEPSFFYEGEKILGRTPETRQKPADADESRVIGNFEAPLDHCRQTYREATLNVRVTSRRPTFNVAHKASTAVLRPGNDVTRSNWARSSPPLSIKCVMSRRFP